jgi:hypothetical protein
VKQRKIVVLGATGSRYESPEVRVEWFPWNKVKKVPNLADYDEVVIDLLSLQDPASLDGGALRRALDVRTTHEVLQKIDGAFYVLGDPRRRTGGRPRP